MYTILVNSDNSLQTTVRERIMQRSKLVDTLHFLVEPTYKEQDMTEFTVTMEYLLPVSREYRTENLVKSDALYKDMLEYKLPFDTALTKEAGEVQVQLTFTRVEMDADGKTTQYVRKTSAESIVIVPVSAWSDVIADSALTALDQRLIQMEAIANSLDEMAQNLFETKADNLVYDNKQLQLTAAGERIGDAVTITSGGIDPDNPDGNMKVVEF